MTTCFLAPDPIQSTQFIPGGNTPANGAQLFFYAAGSSTKQTVYKDNAASVAWTNPIVLDSGGNLPSGGEVWFPQGQTFKVVFAPSNDTDPPASPYWTKDNLAGTNDVSAQTGVEWISGPTPTFVSTTQFTLAGDQTATFTVGRRIKTTNTAGTVYSTITSSSFGVNTTTVNVVNDGSGVLDSGLSAVSYGVFDPANPSISASEVNRKGNAIASAGNGTTNIWASSGDYEHITGTNNIFHFSTAPYAGAAKSLIFDGALQVNSSAALSTPGNVNISTTANTRIDVRADTVSTYVLSGITGQLQSSSTILAGPSSAANAIPGYRAVDANLAAWTLLSASSAASSASIDFTSGLISSSAFDQYRLVITNLQAQTVSTVPLLRFSQDGGSTFITTLTYVNASHGIDNAGNTVSSLGNGFGVFLSEAGGIAASSSLTFNASVLLSALSDTVARKAAGGLSTYAGPTGNFTGFQVACIFNGNANAINALRVVMASGNIQKGNFALYGLRKS